LGWKGEKKKGVEKGEKRKQEVAEGKGRLLLS
jgi:hypothetical protein